MNHLLMRKKFLPLFIFVTVVFSSCDSLSGKRNQSDGTIKSGTSQREDTVYQSENLIIHKLSDHVFAHTSFLSTQDFGDVPCNGMIVINDNEAVIFDTPSDNKSSMELINYVASNLQSEINGVISTHFHEDCVGGVEKFNEYNIPVYASNTTIEELENKNRIFLKPIQGFTDSLVLNLGKEKVYAGYFGEGHTRDNVIGYYPKEDILFGGCLIKELGAKKGNLEDANTREWPETVRKIKQKYSQMKIVIPGHGKPGGPELLDYTIKLFEQQK